ncbi:MAG: hypothetical protein K0R88_268 [Solirubrobacterales bacterium]|nr:hypothetical protein [Solirubrobacterales bacterium]
MSRTAADLGLFAVAFAGATGLAELFGAANMGTALSFGVLAFTAALIWVLRRPNDRR